MNYLKENLEIILITYNRAKEFKNTLNACLREDSPIKDIDFTIIDNCSTDKTYEVCNNFSNVKYIKNPINIGGNANICRAMEYAHKKYVWFLCDDDFYDWSSWDEIENALKEDIYDAILLRRIRKTKTEEEKSLFSNFSFVPAAIYKTENITPTLLTNAYDNIKNMFPHLVLGAKIINENKKVYIPEKSIVKTGISGGNTTYRRGIDSKHLPDSKLFMLWGVGFLNSTEYIKDKDKRAYAIQNAHHYISSIFDSLYTFFVHTLFLNLLACEDFEFNKYQLKRLLSFNQKLIFYRAKLYVKFKTFFMDKSLYKPYSTNIDWIEYFKKVSQQRHIDKLARKYKDKRVLIYGAGQIFNILNEKYDLSKLNIIAISDGKFTTETVTFKNFKAIPVPEINNKDYDVILFTLFRNKEIEQSLKQKGIYIKSESLIKHSLKLLWNI